MADKTTPAAKAVKVHTIAKFVGHVGTERRITKKDQDALIGVSGVATADLIWPKGNTQIDVTDVHEDVLDYLKSDDEFKLKTVEAPASDASA